MQNTVPDLIRPMRIGCEMSLERIWKEEKGDVLIRGMRHCGAKNVEKNREAGHHEASLNITTTASNNKHNIISLSFLIYSKWISACQMCRISRIGTSKNCSNSSGTKRKKAQSSKVSTSIHLLHSFYIIQPHGFVKEPKD
jgi:hypothetical protein